MLLVVLYSLQGLMGLKFKLYQQGNGGKGGGVILNIDAWIVVSYEREDIFQQNCARIKLQWFFPGTFLSKEL